MVPRQNHLTVCYDLQSNLETHCDSPEILQFIATELLISFHKKTPAIFFDDTYNLNPASIGLTRSRYTAILRALSANITKRGAQKLSNDTWSPVFNTDKELIMVMKVIREHCSSLAYHKNAILSTDDDLIRCRSKKVHGETGFSHINNPRKG